jgi:hypothetical protein
VNFDLSAQQSFENLMHDVLSRRKRRRERARICEQATAVLFIKTSHIIPVQPVCHVNKTLQRARFV